MTVFACHACGTPLTGPLTESEVDSSPTVTDGLQPLMARGTFTTNDDEDDGPIGAIILNPDDIQGVRRHSDRRRLNGCCDLDGLDGPNLVCATCGAEVATLQNDCWVSWTLVRLESAAVTTV